MVCSPHIGILVGAAGYVGNFETSSGYNIGANRDVMYDTNAVSNSNYEESTTYEGQSLSNEDTQINTTYALEDKMNEVIQYNKGNYDIQTPTEIVPPIKQPEIHYEVEKEENLMDAPFANMVRSYPVVDTYSLQQEPIKDEATAVVSREKLAELIREELNTKVLYN